MDKNMINIDDLLKQRLANGEEKQRPGAWLQMRELLDKEMPQRSVPGAAFNWRRMMGYLAGMALLATVSIGGYQVATKINTDSETNKTISQAVNGNSTAQQSTANNKPSSGNQNTNSNNSTTTVVSNNDNNSTKTTVASETGDNSVNNKTIGNSQPQPVSNNIAANTKKQTTGKNDKSRITASEQALPSANKGLAASGTTTKAVANNELDANTASSHNMQKNNSLSVGNDIVNSSNGTANVPANNASTTTQDAATTQRNFGSGANTAKSLPVKSTLQQPAINAPTTANAKVNTGNSNTGSTNALALGTPASPANAGNTNSLASANKNNAPANKQDQETQLAEEKNLINKIETKEKYSRTTGWKKDTIATGKVEWPVEQMLAKTDEKTADNTVVPAASMSLKANEENLVPLADYKVSGKQTKHYEKVNHFAEMVENAKMRMGSVHFYPGVIVGANTSLAGQNSLFGFQLGAVGNLSLNDRWGILTELKYVQRMRKDSKLDDNFISNLDSTISPSGQKMYTFDSTQHYFNYTNVSSIELPIAIKYSLKRLNFFGGGNLVYNLGVANVTEYKYNYEKETPAATATINYEWANGAPKITITDFKSRFSVGYLIGAGYQLSPAMQLDIRLTQNLWDNAKTEGAKMISKDIYKMPSVQINMSYRFSSNKNRPMKAR